MTKIKRVIEWLVKVIDPHPNAERDLTHRNSHHARSHCVLFTYSDAARFAFLRVCLWGACILQLGDLLSGARTTHTACTHAYYERSGCVYLNAPRGRVLSCIMTSN